MCRRADRQKIKQRIFAVTSPVVGKKSGIRTAAVADQIRMPVLHILEIDPAVYLVGQFHDLSVIGKALLDRQNSAKQQGRVDRRNLAVTPPRTGLIIDKMVEPAVIVKRLV